MTNDQNISSTDDDTTTPNKILGDYYKLPFEYRCNYENAILLREQFLYMKEKSFYQEDSIMENSYMINYDKFAEYIFLTCAELNLSHDCKYIAYELFKKFLYIHIIKLLKSLKKQIKKQSEITEYWDYINGKLKEQLLLRILSCVQIASKMNNRNECISNETLYIFLDKANTPFTMDAIAKSELRVFSTVGFMAVKHDNLFSYYESHVLAIEKDLEGFNLDNFYSLGLKILDVVQINWTVILKSFTMCLQELETNESTTEQQRRQLLNDYNHHQLPGLEHNSFRKMVTKHIQNNHVIISCGVIAATVYILGAEYTKKIVQILAKNIEVDVKVVAIAATYIFMFLNSGE